MITKKTNSHESKDYPILKKADNETAMIYLMNTPQHEGGYPNNDQLRGCIYDVKYNGKSLNMTASSKEIGNKCKKVCLNDICNNGECFETFSDKPICDCKLTMNNGQYCNTSFVQLNDRKLHGNKEIIRMEYIKLVLFNSSDKDLFHIKYGHFKFLIKRENSSLLAKYEDSENRFVETALSKGAYGANPSIVLMRFYAKYIYFQMFNGNLNTSISMPITRDIFYESLDSVFVSHEADMMYKTKHLQYGWCSSSLDGSGNTASKCLKFEKHLIEKKSEKKLPISAMFLKSVTELNNGISQSAFISILVIEIVFVIVFSVLIVILIKSRSKLKDRKGNNIADKMPSSAQPLIHNV